MRFLLDQNVDRRLAAAVRELGHDVTVVAVDYPAGLLDDDILEIAAREGRTIVTNDRDFGELVIRAARPHAGVLFLRLQAPDFATKKERLLWALTHHASDLRDFVVVTDAIVRVRRTSQHDEAP